jgi:hypothetical protein
MIAASSIGIFLVPMLYVIFQRMRERVKAASKSPSRLNPPVDETV